MRASRLAETRRDAVEKLRRGYKRLAGFEVTGGGFEWFGKAPAHEALTAYGLLQFAEIERTIPGLVDTAMVRRARDWMRSRSKGAETGRFDLSSKAIDSFGRAPEATTHAYILWAIMSGSTAGSSAGNDYRDHVDRAISHAKQSKDGYLLALTAAMCLSIPDQDAQYYTQGIALAKRLENEYQGEDGSVSQAETTITQSRGVGLVTETTSLAAIAWMAAQENKNSASGIFSGACARAVRFLLGRATPRGFGTTQGTVLALRAIVTYAMRQNKNSGDFRGKLYAVAAGKRGHEVMVKADSLDPVRVPVSLSIRSILAEPGDHKLAVALQDLPSHGGKPNNPVKWDPEVTLPYDITVRFRTPLPESSDGCPVRATLGMDTQITEVPIFYFNSCYYFAFEVSVLARASTGTDNAAFVYGPQPREPNPGNGHCGDRSPNRT